VDFAEETLWRAAYHEAGHIVIGHMLGIEHSHVSIVSTGNVLGEARLARRLVWPRGMRPRRKFADKHAIMSYAGAAAERHRFGTITGSDIADRERATVLIARRWTRSTAARDDRIEATARRLEVRANMLVCKHWGRIDRVAQALVAQRTLTANDLRAVLSNKPAPADGSITCFLVAGSTVTVWRFRVRVPIYARNGPPFVR
jgi:ATP-dependent Zn protease